MNRYRYAFASAFKFSRSEFWPFLIAVIFSGFVLSFRKWGTTSFNATEGISNLLLYSILFMIIYFLFIAAQKFVAAYMGYDCTLELWYYGPVIGLLITFMTYGYFPFLYLGGVKLKENPTLRLGKYRHYLNVKDMMYVGIAGPMFIILLLILIVQPLYFASQAAVLKDIVIAATWILLFSSLPLPKTNGLNVLLKSRLIWLLYFAFSVGMFILLRQLDIATYVAAGVIGIVAILLIRKVASSGLFNM
ncbi:MAG: hypothetical protein ACP5N2_07540 [Candidatus Nanoarchaeia archaeon]